MAYTQVAASGDVALNTMKAVTAAGKKLLLVRTDSGLTAMNSTCTHLGADLSKGQLDAGQIVCPKHGARFDAATGNPCGAAKILFFKMNVKGLAVYPVKEENGAILVSL